MTTTADVARIARQVGEAGDRGDEEIRVGHVVFNLIATRLCAMFVRQVHEAALGLPPFGWPWASDTARHMEDKLVANRKGTEFPLPGDIVGLNKGTGTSGHIGIYLGGDPPMIAENTSSTARRPGTGLSRLSEVASEVSGYYRVLPAVDPDAPDEWAETGWGWARAEGYMDGTRPRDPVTRQQLAVVLYRLDGDRR